MAKDDSALSKLKLTKVIDYVEKLKEVDIQGAEATSQTTGLINAKRGDVIDPTQCLSSEEALSGAKEEHNGYFVAPHVFSSDSNE